MLCISNRKPLAALAMGTSCSVVAPATLASAATGSKVLSLWPKFHTLRKKRWLPSTPASFHSKVASGGAVNMVYRRAVSAPCCSIKSCGSTPLFLDLDMVPTPS